MTSRPLGPKERCGEGDVCDVYFFVRFVSFRGIFLWI